MSQFRFEELNRASEAGYETLHNARVVERTRTRLEALVKELDSEATSA